MGTLFDAVKRDGRFPPAAAVDIPFGY